MITLGHFGWLADVIRITFLAASGVLVVLLLTRASKYRARTRETARLHLMAVFFMLGAMAQAFNNIGDSRLHPVTPLNFLGLIFGWTFIVKTPLDRVETWKERSADPTRRDDVDPGAGA